MSTMHVRWPRCHLQIALAVILKNAHSTISQIPYKAPTMCTCMGTRQRTWSMCLHSHRLYCLIFHITFKIKLVLIISSLKNLLKCSRILLPFAGIIKKVRCCNESLEATIFPHVTNNEEWGTLQAHQPSHWPFSLRNAHIIALCNISTV